MQTPRRSINKNGDGKLIDVFLFFQVIRAKVVGVPRVGRLPNNLTAGVPLKYLQPQVYTLRVLKAYKGAMKLNRTVGFKPHGVAKSRNLRVKLFTPSKISSCRVKLRKDKMYVFGGYVAKKKLSLNRCGWISVWSNMSLKKRRKLLYYRRMCKCNDQSKNRKKCKNKIRRKKQIKEKKWKARKRLWAGGFHLRDQ